VRHWRSTSKALRQRGWRVHACASDVPETVDGLRLGELSYQSADALELRRRLFPRAGDAASDTGPELVAEIRERASMIRTRVEEYLDEHGVRLVHIRNLMSLPYNLPATLAFYGLIVDRTDVHFVLQHHDLYWEGPNARNFESPYTEVTRWSPAPPVPSARIQRMS
jgi:hypothetical protein